MCKFFLEILVEYLKSGIMQKNSFLLIQPFKVDFTFKFLGIIGL
jgi:hypothetical protein